MGLRIVYIALMGVILITYCIIADTKDKKHRMLGLASYYSTKYEGRMCADNEHRFSNSKLYAAHCSLPFGTKVRVTNLKNGERVIVTIVDRGPFNPGTHDPHNMRIIDLSQKAARSLGMIQAGVIEVKLEVIK